MFFQPRIQAISLLLSAVGLMVKIACNQLSRKIKKIITKLADYLIEEVKRRVNATNCLNEETF